jgi:hypothetical protein
VASVDQLYAALRVQQAALQGAISRINDLQGHLGQLQSRPTTVQEEIDAQPGRRIESALSGEVAFTASDVGQRANPIVIQVSQDGPFVMTHYPHVVWRPSAPTNTTNFGRWRPVCSAYLPTQQVTTDFIDIMYEMNDGGSQRQMQNAPRGPMLSRPDNIVPAPLPTLWSPNAAIIFQPTYLSLTWNSATAPTAGILHVDLIGYRIANL